MTFRGEKIEEVRNLMLRWNARVEVAQRRTTGQFQRPKRDELASIADSRKKRYCNTIGCRASCPKLLRPGAISGSVCFSMRAQVK